MKKLVLGAIVCAAATMASCVKSDAPGNCTTRGVRMFADVSDVRTKAPINSGFTTDFSTGIYAKNATWGGGILPEDEIVNDNATVSGLAGHPVVFSQTYNYPINGDLLTFYAYAPHGTETLPYNSTTNTSPQVTIAMTGQEDIMWATGSGNKVLGNDPVLHYTHKLSQLQFTFKSGFGFAPTGYKVVGLVIKAQPSAAIMTVETGDLTYSGSVDMNVPLAPGGVMIASAGTDALSPIMTKPANSFVADITVQPITGSNYSYLAVPVTLTAEMGKAHMVTFTFNETSVNATATVADWITGSGVNVGVQ